MNEVLVALGFVLAYAAHRLRLTSKNGDSLGSFGSLFAFILFKALWIFLGVWLLMVGLEL